MCQSQQPRPPPYAAVSPRPPPTPLQGRITLLLSLYLEYGLVVRHSLYTQPIFSPPATATAATVSAPRPTRLRVYHSSVLRGTSQSFARYLLTALLLQVYHSYQSSSHLPCATQPCLNISGWGWSVGCIEQDRNRTTRPTRPGSRLTIFYATAAVVVSTPLPARQPALLRVYRSYQSVSIRRPPPQHQVQDQVRVSPSALIFWSTPLERDINLLRGVQPTFAYIPTYCTTIVANSRRLRMSRRNASR